MAKAWSWASLDQLVREWVPLVQQVLASLVPRVQVQLSQAQLDPAALVPLALA